MYKPVGNFLCLIHLVHAYPWYAHFLYIDSRVSFSEDGINFLQTLALGLDPEYSLPMLVLLYRNIRLPFRPKNMRRHLR
jgi:hypothetical protein